MRKYLIGRSKIFYSLGGVILIAVVAITLSLNLGLFGSQPKFAHAAPSGGSVSPANCFSHTSPPDIRFTLVDEDPEICYSGTGNLRVNISNVQQVYYAGSGSAALKLTSLGGPCFLIYPNTVRSLDFSQSPAEVLEINLEPDASASCPPLT